MNLDLITAVLLGLAGFATGLRQIILSPRNQTFPKAPEFVRSVMFIVAVSLAGGAMLFFGHISRPGFYAGEAAGPVSLFALGLLIYNAALLYNILRQRYSPEVWARLNRITETVKNSCPDTKPGIPAPLHVARRP
jgi:hypothetical protein